MIEILREMILGVTTAAIFSAVMLQFAQKSALEEVVRLAAGMLLILALLTPLSRTPINAAGGQLRSARSSVVQQTQQAQAQNEKIAQSSVAGAISTYLEEQAQAIGMPCRVNIALAAAEDGTMRIASVEVQGETITAERRDALRTLIMKSCGVSQENISFEER